MENQVDQANKIFLDSDTIDWLPTWATYGYNNHYTANLRYMPQAGYPDWGADNSGNTYFHQHRANVLNGSRVMIVWDAGQRLDSYEDGRADPISWALDNWQSNWGHAYLAPVPGYSYFNVQSYGIPIELGDPSLGNNSLAGQKSANQDLTVNAWRGPAMRFRHIKNSVMNALYADGHVEPKHLGEVMVRDVCMNR
jgi:prepilin-type processing-associated H-X9-DG protein